MSDAFVEALLKASDAGVAVRPMLEVARLLVDGGWPVFPCALTKSPLVAGGFKARSADLAQVETWWATHPDALPAIVPADGGLAALDVDSPAAAQALKDAGLWRPDHFLVRTAGTSAPYEFDGAMRSPAHVYVRATAAPKIPGVVVRHDVGYVIAPGARRGDRIYYVAHRFDPVILDPTQYVFTITTPPPTAVDRAPDLARVEQAVRHIPNPPEVDREQYVAMAHLIKGAAGDAGRDLFLEWAAKWEGGAVDPAEDERVYDTIREPKAGWSALWRRAERHGFDASRERQDDAAADFADAPDAPSTAVEPTPPVRIWFTFGELEDHPELRTPPEPLVPYLAWAGLKTLMAAREKAGKSTLAMAGAVAVSHGRPFLGVETAPTRVLWLTEESNAILYVRGQLMGAHRDNFAIMPMAREPAKDLGHTVRAFRPQLIVFDTLFRFARLDDENNASEWHAVINILDHLSSDGVSLLLLAHSLKTSPDGEYRGSSALGGLADAILSVKRPKDGDRIRQVRAVGRINLCREFRARLLPGDREYALADNAPDAAADKATRAVRAALADHVKRAKTVITGLVKLPADQVATALEQLYSAGAIQFEERQHGGKTTRYWYVPDASEELA